VLASTYLVRFMLIINRGAVAVEEQQRELQALAERQRKLQQALEKKEKGRARPTNRRTTSSSSAKRKVVSLINLG
jgi:hypothetical protein